MQLLSEKKEWYRNWCTLLAGFCIGFEKLAFTMVTASRKLQPYFQMHIIQVLTEYPLRKVMLKLNLSSRMANWATELGEFDL